MDSAITAPPYDQLLRAAETVARQRSDVDVDLAQEVFLEAATLLHNGLALDGLDAHDAHAVVAWLSADLVAGDPGEAIRDRSRDVHGSGEDLHDPESVARALLISAAILKL